MNLVRRQTSIVITCAAMCVLLTRLTAQRTSTTAQVPDVQKLGPQAGTAVPDFTLVDQTGQSRTLKSLLGPRGLMLVFFRSADW